jgi:WD40 repeat protein
MYRLASIVGQSVQLWTFDPATGALTKDMMREGKHKRQYTSMAWSDDEETLYLASLAGDVTVMTVATGKVEGSFNLKSGGLLALAFQMEKNQPVLYAGGQRGNVVMFKWDGADWVDTRKMELPGPVTVVAFAPLSPFFIAGTREGRLYTLNTNTLSSNFLGDSHVGSVVQVKHIPNDANNFVTVAHDCFIKVWDSKTGRVVAENRFSSKPLCVDVAPTEKGAIAIAGCEDGYLRAMLVQTGEFLWEIPRAHNGAVTCVTVSNNGLFFVTGGTSGEVKVWGTDSRIMVSVLKEHSRAVTAVKIYDDDLHMLSVSADKSMLLWDLQKEKRIAAHTQQMGGINDIALNKDQSLILTVGAEKKITYWNIKETFPVFTQNSASGAMNNCISLSPCGGKVVVGAADSTIALYDVASRQLVSQAFGACSSVQGASFSANGKQIVTVGAFGNIHMWNVL